MGRIEKGQFFAGSEENGRASEQEAQRAALILIVARLNSIEDMMAIGGSELIQKSRDETPEGMQVIFYECDD